MTEIIIRASSTSGYADCQLMAVIAAMPGILRQHGHELHPSRPNIGALIGTGVHGAGEVGLTEKITGSLAPTSVLEEAGIDTFRKRLEEETEQGGPLVMDDDSPSTDKAELQIRRMTKRWRIDILERVRPVAVENRIEASLPGHPNVKLSGQSDLLALSMDGKSGAIVLRDLKTSRHKKTPLNHAPQIGCYSLLWRTKGQEPNQAQIDLLRRVREGKEQPCVEEQPLDIVRCENMAWAVLNDMAAKARLLADSGDPSHLITNPGSRLCSDKYCRAHGLPICAATRKDQ